VVINQGTLHGLRSVLESVGVQVSAVNLDQALSCVAPHPQKDGERSRSDVLDLAVFSELKPFPTAEGGGPLGIVQLARDFTTSGGTIPAGAYLLSATRAASGGLEATFVDAGGRELKSGLQVEVRPLPPSDDSQRNEPYAVMAVGESAFAYPGPQSMQHFVLPLALDGLLSQTERADNTRLAREKVAELADRKIDLDDVDPDGTLRGRDGDADVLCVPVRYDRDDTDNWPRPGYLLGVLAVLSGTLKGSAQNVNVGTYAVRADEPGYVRLEEAKPNTKDIVIPASRLYQVRGKVALKCACLLDCCIGRC
jgi:hypothetical protein